MVAPMVSNKAFVYLLLLQEIVSHCSLWSNSCWGFLFLYFRFKKNLKAFYFVHPTFRSKVRLCLTVVKLVLVIVREESFCWLGNFTFSLAISTEFVTTDPIKDFHTNFSPLSPHCNQTSPNLVEYLDDVKVKLSLLYYLLW